MSAKSEQLERARRELDGRYKARPTTLVKLARFLAEGNARTTAVKACGISYDTFLDWLRASPGLAALVEEAEVSALTGCVGIVRRAATPHKVVRTKVVTKEGEVVSEETTASREFDWKAAAWLLERRDPENWKERKEIDLSRLNNEQLVALWKATEPVGGDGAPGPGADGGDAGPARDAGAGRGDQPA